MKENKNANERKTRRVCGRRRSNLKQNGAGRRSARQARHGEKSFEKKATVVSVARSERDSPNRETRVPSWEIESSLGSAIDILTVSLVRWS
jgi:hypothetical protein